MKRYSLTECYELLDVDPKTFRSWLAKADITAEQSRADPRVKYLTEEHVKQLADAHERTLTTTNGKQDRTIPQGNYKLLFDQISEEVKQQAQMLRLLGDALRDHRQYVEQLGVRLITVEAKMERLIADIKATEINQTHADA